MSSILFMNINLHSKSLLTLTVSTLVLSGALIGSTANAVNNNASANGQTNGIGIEHQPVCGPASQDSARCHSRVVVGSDHVTPLAKNAPNPMGLDPAEIKSIYSFPTSPTAGAGKTIAIVDAYDDPNALSDLNDFSAAFDPALPTLIACTTESAPWGPNGCFKKVNQTGGASLPRANAGWALEISLDIQWAHAIAPGATILLVEANSARFSDLLAAEDYAGAHASYVSNSWGGSEFATEQNYDLHFTGNGVSYFVSSGDSGLPAEYPSSSPNVISVGGTTLNFDSSGNFTTETGWIWGGGGCSAYETATTAQSGFESLCSSSKRATPDVSLVADPASGVSVYDSFKYRGQSGWFVVGGTSASSPMWAARSAVSGAVVNSAYVYTNHITFRDIESGGNSAGCSSGFDLCSGRGSWTGATP